MRHAKSATCLAGLLLLGVLLVGSSARAAGSSTVPPSASPSAAVPETVLPFALSPLRAKKVLEWTVGDVEYWMNHTIGYGEYAAYIRANLVDGVTLLEMEPADFESYLPITNALHALKIAAHVKLLKGLCHCEVDGAAAGSGAAVDFWSYMKEHSVRTWVGGTTAMFFPRWAMAGAYFFDRGLYDNLVSSPTSPLTAMDEADALADEHGSKRGRVVSTPKAVAYWAAFVVQPDLYMAYQAARLTPRNWILMPCIVGHFLAQAFSEVSLLITIYRKTAFKPETSLIGRVWAVFSYTLFAPLLGVVVGYVFPVVLQYVTVAVIILHSLLMILGIAILLFNDGLAAAATGPEDPSNRPPAENGAEAGGTGAADGQEDVPKAASAAPAGEAAGSTKSEKID